MSFEASKLFDLIGQVALVTGGGTGLGAIITQAYIENGASKVFITGRRKDKLEETANRINSLGGNHTGKVIPLVGDVSSKEGIFELISDFRKVSDSLDILVNNAGVLRMTDEPRAGSTTSLESPEEFSARHLKGDYDGWVESDRINALAPYFLSVGLLPLLAEAAEKGNARGNVIVVASIAGLTYSPVHSASYQASKAAAVSVTKGLATRFSPYLVRVNAIVPGIYPTDMSVPLTNETVRLSIPLKKFGEPEEIAGIALYLASKAGGYAHGSNFVLDGGRVLSLPS